MIKSVSVHVFHQRNFSNHMSNSVPSTAGCNSEDMFNENHLTVDFYSGWHVTPNSLMIFR